jgi:predicted phage terminase large subunit-like protein
MSAAKRQAVNEWFGTTLYSRLDNKRTDAIVIVMQRLHPEDLVAHVKGLEKWEHLNLPAISDEPAEVEISDTEVYQRAAGEVLHPERESLEELQVIREALGSAAFSAQYLQQPLPPGSALVKWNWFRRYPAPFVPRHGDTFVLSWDPALVPGAENSYSVCTTWAVRNDKYFLIDLWRDRVDYPTLRERCFRSLTSWPKPYTVVEGTAHGAALHQELRALCFADDPRVEMSRIGVFTPTTDKISRLTIQSAKIERGQVYLPDHAPWLAAFKEELLHFPHGRHNDQVDSLSQFLYRMDFPPFSGPSIRVTAFYGAQ